MLLVKSLGKGMELMGLSIKSSELHNFYGQLVHVVYAVKSEMVIQNGNVAFTKDQSITPPVVLISYDPNSQEVEIQRVSTSSTEWIRPTLVFLS